MILIVQWNNLSRTITRLTDMYSGGFYPFPDDETRWAFWARNIYINRYMSPPKPVYDDLLALVRTRDYFVITTNVDHCFQRAGFDKERLFYTQGDYGLFQRADGRIKETYDNEAWVRKAMAAQRFLPGEGGVFLLPKDRLISMRIPHELIPVCPDGSPAAMNLRTDDTFVEDAGWHAAADRYAEFLQSAEGKHILFLELGVGSNTPVICSLYTRDYKKVLSKRQISAISNSYQLGNRRCA